MSLLKNKLLPGELQKYAAISKCFIGSLQCKANIGGLRYHVLQPKIQINAACYFKKQNLSESTEVTAKYSVSMLKKNNKKNK